MAAVDDGTLAGWIFRGLLGGLMFLIGLYSRQRTKDISEKHKEIKEDLSSQGSRLDSEIKELRKSTVPRLEYDQHVKHEDERYNAIMRALQDTVKVNSAEHARICGKVDLIPSMINDQVNVGIESLRREITALIKSEGKG